MHELISFAILTNVIHSQKQPSIQSFLQSNKQLWSERLNEQQRITQSFQLHSTGWRFWNAYNWKRKRKITAARDSNDQARICLMFDQQAISKMITSEMG